MVNNSHLDPKTWQIRLFGPIEIITPDGKAASVTGKRAGELLAYLALHPNQPQPREKLIELIWGETEVGDARARLRQELQKLRTLFGTSSDSPLDITRDDCQLIIQTYIVDATRLLACYQTVSRNASLIEVNAAVDEAIALYRADLLSGYDAPWIAAERTRLSQVFNRTLLMSAEAQRKGGDFAGAESTLRALLIHDPICEEAHVGLMRVFADQGQPSQVQRQYRAMEDALQAGLGVGPTTASQQLATALREEAGSRTIRSERRAVPEDITEKVTVDVLAASSQSAPGPRSGIGAEHWRNSTKPRYRGCETVAAHNCCACCPCGTNFRLGEMAACCSL